MKSFEGDKIEQQPIPRAMLRSVRLLGEFKGRQTLYARQTPQLLDVLRQTAIVQSTESSNRIEGVVAPFERIQSLVAQKTTPQNRSEQEIAGYRDVLNTVHTNHAHIPFTPNIVLQLHGDLYHYTPAPGGRWKSVDNEIIETRPDGTRMVRFRPVAAWLTPSDMDDLHQAFNARWNAEADEPLLLIAAYVLDFLCIHPFLDGNGRMARLLTLLLLFKAGYDVGRYISLERVVEDSKESYYATLHASSQSWHEGEHDLRPWTEYLFGTLLAAYRQFEERVGVLQTARGAKGDMVRDAFARLPDEFRMADLESACPNVTRDMMRVILNRLKADGRVEVIGHGAGARWRKRSPLP